MDDVNMFVLKVIAHNRPVFEQLVFQIEDRLVLLSLLTYVEETWVTGTIWPIPSWSVHNNGLTTIAKDGTSG